MKQRPTGCLAFETTSCIWIISWMHIALLSRDSTTAKKALCNRSQLGSASDWFELINIFESSNIQQPKILTEYGSPKMVLSLRIFLMASG